MRAARHAGKNPDSTPVTTETSSEMQTIVGDIAAGIAFCNSNVAGHAIKSAMTPPIRQMHAASIKNCKRIVRFFAPCLLYTSRCV